VTALNPWSIVLLADSNSGGILKDRGSIRVAIAMRSEVVWQTWLLNWDSRKT